VIRPLILPPRPLLILPLRRQLILLPSHRTLPLGLELLRPCQTWERVLRPRILPLDSARLLP
jgi:hypothetical protein